MHVDLVPILGPSFSIKLGKQGTGSYQLWLETGALRGAFTTHQHRAQSGPIKGGSLEIRAWMSGFLTWYFVGSLGDSDFQLGLRTAVVESLRNIC